MSKFKYGDTVLDPGKKLIFGDSTEQANNAPTKVESDFIFLSKTGQAVDSDALSGASKSTDGTFSSNSDLLIPTVKALKTFADVNSGGYEISLSPTDVLTAPSNNTNYYYGSGSIWNIFSVGSIRVPKAGTIKTIMVTYIAGGSPSSHVSTFYIYSSNTGDTQIGQVSGNLDSLILNTNLVVTTSTYLIIKFYTANWSVKPDGIYSNASVFIQI